MCDYLPLIFEKKYDEADIVRKKSIPKKLLKFYSLGNDNRELDSKKLQTLREGKIWFSSVEKLNDPYEYKCMYIDEDALRTLNYSKSDIVFLKNQLNNLTKEYGLASLSANDYNYLPMWAYYTNNYAGFCVEYDVEKADKIFPISYEPNRISVSNILDRYYSEIKRVIKNKSESCDIEFYNRVLMQQFFLKQNTWKHENEYRVIYPLDADTLEGRAISIIDIGIKTSRIIAGIKCQRENINELSAISKVLKCEFVKLKISENDYIFMEEA